MPERTHVAVVGGGYAGMAAAVELSDRGIPVTVFEAAPQLGGRARRVDYRGVVLDNGLHILSGAYRETLRLLERVHPQSRQALLRMPLQWTMHREFRLAVPHLPAPLHLFTALLSARGISVSERASVARFIAALGRSRYALEQDTGVDALLDHYRQSEKLRRVLWHPLCTAALNTPPAIASAQVFANVLRDTLCAQREASDVLISRVDLSALFPQPAAQWVARHGGRVLTARRVTSIEPAADGFRLEAAGQCETYSHVVCALPPHLVHTCVGDVAALSEVAARTDAFQYQPIHSVWLQYPASVPLPAPMLGFADSIVHWVFDREKLCGQRGLIGAVISAQGAHQELTREQLAARVHRELRQRLGPLPDPVWQYVIAEKRATFSCVPGIRRPPQVTPLPNFYLAGDYTASEFPATIEAAIRSGVLCARSIAPRATG